MDVDTAIVGAGPYGLSIAAHLRAQGQTCEVFGTPLESWRTFMPEGMMLKSERFASNLWDPKRLHTLERYCHSHSLPYQSVGSPVELALFLQYADWFRKEAVGSVRETKISCIERAENGFRMQLTDGSDFCTRRVVLATGHMPFRMIPAELAQLPEPLVLHSGRIGDVKNYAGRSVCIIGAGQSALETAAILHENGAEVRLLIRRGRIEWNPPSKPRSFVARIFEPDAGVATGWKSVAVSELPRVFRWRYEPALRHWFVANSYGPSGSWWLRDRVVGKVDVLLDSSIISAAANDRGDGVILRTKQGTNIAADHVMAATGYRANIDRLEYLDPELNKAIVREARGIPALSSSFESSVPGLFIVGILSAPVFGPIMRFMYGAKHAAPIVARKLATN